MANDDIWILGINMTKFGKHPDKDVVDLASEAALAALADGGVTIKEMGVLAAGNLMGAAAGIGQQLQKQIGQTGIPVFNVANACATGATALRTVIMAIKAGECDMGLAVGVEKLSGAGMLGAGFGGAASDEWTPAGRYGAVSGFEGKLGTDMMPGVFAQVGMEYLHKHPYDGADFELFAGISAKNHFNSTMNPLAAIQKDMSVEQIMADTSAYRSRCHAGSWWCQMVGRPSRALATAIEAGRFIGMDPRFSMITRSASATADRTSAVRRSISSAVAAPTPWLHALPAFAVLVGPPSWLGYRAKFPRNLDHGRNETGPTISLR